MNFRDVAAILDGIPCTAVDRGKILYDFVRTGAIQNILELGFAHGVSTCYMAAALDVNNSGSITTIDLQSARLQRPDISTLLGRTGLKRYVNVIFADTSYTWELMKIIEAQTSDGVCTPVFDFCFVDGAHQWEPDGFAFFLVEKLLKPGSWILFDDLAWSFAESPTLKDEEFVTRMPDDQRNTPQVRKVFSLLVQQHPHFNNFRCDENWGWAQKQAGANRSGVRHERLVDHVYSQGIKDDAVYLARKVWTRVRR